MASWVINADASIESKITVITRCFFLLSKLACENFNSLHNDVAQALYLNNLQNLIPDIYNSLLLVFTVCCAISQRIKKQ